MIRKGRLCKLLFSGAGKTGGEVGKRKKVFGGKGGEEKGGGGGGNAAAETVKKGEGTIRQERQETCFPEKKVRKGGLQSYLKPLSVKFEIIRTQVGRKTSRGTVQEAERGKRRKE